MAFDAGFRSQWGVADDIVRAGDTRVARNDVAVPADELRRQSAVFTRRINALRTDRSGVTVTPPHHRLEGDI